MKYNISKILLFVIIVIFSKSCVITQKIGKDDIVLNDLSTATKIENKEDEIID